MKTCAVILIIIVFSPLQRLALAQVDLEKIVVRPKEAHKAYAGESISAANLKAGDSASATSALEFASGVDLRTRGPGGTQADPSIRGSTYEEVAVLIDGIRVADPQTGHYNLDIPLTRFDLQRVEVIKEPSSAFYGSGAFAGAVNLVTRKPDQNACRIESWFGEHALRQQGFSFSRADGDFSSRFSYEHSAAKAAVANTDFEHKTGSLYLNKELDGLGLDLLAGYQEKDYGASSFYSNLFPEEEEHTRTFFTRAGMRYSFDPVVLEEHIYVRRHRDKFILNRNNPVSVNYHTTYVYGAQTRLRIPLDGLELSTGIDTSRQEINSSNLGKHQRQGQALFLGLVPDLGSRFDLDLRLRTDYYEGWDWHHSFNLGAAWWCIQELVKLRSSFSRAFRIPSFTELYYRDPANIGNTQLKAEQSEGLTLGALIQRSCVSVNLDGFFRRSRDTIDWTRADTQSPWQATNLGKVDFKGAECGMSIDRVFSAGPASLNRMRLSYTYTQAENRASGFLSKYALDVLKHQALLAVEGKMFGCQVSTRFSYNQRRFGESYFIGDITFSRKINCREALLEPFVTIDNIADTHYSEVGGVIQPGRWVKSGLRLSW